MVRKLGQWFAKLTKYSKVALVTAGVFGLTATATAGHNPAPTILNTTPAKSSSAQSQDKVEHKTLTTTEVVPFTSTNIENNSLTKGSTKVLTPGINGVLTHTFDITYTNGTETSRTEVSNNVTTAPVNEVVTVGTYVAPVQLSCPNGTYVNSAGNTVCSPYESPGAPSGATAQCVDGSYSFSQSSRGTCSHHGGVASWL